MITFPNKKILITGGAGYIGSHLCLALTDSQADVAIIDNLSTGFTSNIQFGTLHTIDLGDWPATDALVQSFQPDAVIHFAGSIVVPDSVSNPIQYYQNNTANSLHLIQSCVKHGVPALLFSSTAAVYGIPESGSCSEASPTHPINPYGQSKRMTEQMLHDIANASHLRYVALRYFNVAGAHPSGACGQRQPNATHLIKIIAQVLSGTRDSLRVFGTDYPTPDGTCIRDYIHVCDLANAHVLALDYLFNGGASTHFNCGYSNGYSVRDVVQTAQRLFGTFPVIDDSRRDGDPPQLIADATKIRQTLGWTPTHNTLSDIIASAVHFERTLAP